MKVDMTSIKFLFIGLFALPFALSSQAAMDEYVTASNRVVRSGWINIDESHYLSGPLRTPEALNSRITIVHRWCLACPGVDGAVRDFQNLAKQFSDTDFVFLTSYYPDATHPRHEVDATLKRLNVSTSVYVGAAPIAVRCAVAHRAMYVVESGDTELWSMRLNNTDIKSLAQYLKKNMDALLEKSIRLAAVQAPGRALVQLKRLAKINPKKAKELKSVTDPLNTAANRQMADFEEKAIALRAKRNPSAVTTFLAKLSAFSAHAPEELKDEIDALAAELGSLKAR